MRIKAVLMVFVATACTAEVDILETEDEGATEGASVTNTARLSGCRGKASNVIPSDNKYVITTFGGPGDHQPMSCGGYANGTTWYAASRQRYGCGSHIKVEANGKCVVLKTDDYGPDVCVENAAGRAIIDVSPLASKHLFGVSGAGYSDKLVVTVTEVSTSTPLGPCTAGGGGGTSGGGTTGGTGGTDTAPTGGASCDSSTLGRDVSDGTCVQSATDGEWYECTDGTWTAKSSSAGCTGESYGFCDSPTLGYAVPARSCVQSAASGTWFQCNGQGWVKPVDLATASGPLGDCSTMNAL